MTNFFPTLAATNTATQSRLSVRLFDHGDAARWDEFVLLDPHASPFHLMAWKRTIEEAFGYQAMYLAAWEGENIEGVLPLFFVKNPVIGSALISTPFAVYGGALCRTEAALIALRDQVTALGKQLGVEYVEIRNAHESQKMGFSPVSRYVTFTSKLGPDPDEILKAIPRKTRAVVRKSLTQMFRTHITRHSTETFELLYSRSLRRLGTPCFPSKYFESLLKNFGPMAEIREIHLGTAPVATVLSLYFRDQVLPYYGASEPEFNAQAPASFMYYDLMRSAGWQGLKVFDFGRSKKNSGGSHDFKDHWGMEVRDLPYEMLLVNRKDLPHFSPANPKFRFAIEAWRKVPLPLTRLVGPFLIRLFP